MTVEAIYSLIDVQALVSAVDGDPFWCDYLLRLFHEQPVPYALHLAVMVEPYLTYVLDGLKTVESRFSAHRIPPYQCIDANDVVLLKRSGGPIVGICRVTRAWFYRLDPSSWGMIRKEFTEAICAQDPDFWDDRATASFASLIEIQDVRVLPPLECNKQDMRGWVVVCSSSTQLSLFTESGLA